MLTWLPDALNNQLQRDAGMTRIEYDVLSWMSMSPGRTARMSYIASSANVSLSHLSRVAGRLEIRGFLTRRPDPEDGRATLATLTEAGWQKVVASAPGHVREVQRTVFDSLTDTQARQLRRISENILRVVRPDVDLRLTYSQAEGAPDSHPPGRA
jgi:DNA-binding MarR family transcriptional regulator